MMKKNVLFVCEANTCRSQMAEGWSHFLYPELISAYSAGITTGPIDPVAIKVMMEAGVDISGQETHVVKDFLQEDISYVITVCNTAAEKCPSFGKEVSVICQSFDDPPALVRGMNAENDKLEVYRRVRDEIKQFIQGLPNNLD